MTNTDDHAQEVPDVPRGARYRVVPLPRSRRVMAALMNVAGSRRLMVAFVEADVTKPWQLIHEHRSNTGESISLTGYVAACLARAVREHPELNSIRRGHRLILFDDVNVVCYLEESRGDEPVVGFLTLRAADRASVRELSMRIRGGNTQGARVPWPMRHLPVAFVGAAVRYLSRNPRFLADAGVIAISNVGAGSGGVPGWGFAPSATSVEVTLGAVAKRLASHDGEIGEREHLCLTVSIDHDLVDGAAGARFVRTLVELVASGDALDEVLDTATGDA